MTARGRRIALGAGVAVAAAAAGAGLAWWRIGLQAPRDDALALFWQQTFADSAGRPWPMADLRGRALVINYWATWCPPCVEEMPELSGLARELEGKPVQILGIGIDNASNIRNFAEKTRFDYPLLIGGVAGNELGRQMGNTGGYLPFTVVVDRAGGIAARILGRFKLDDLRRRTIAAIG